MSNKNISHITISLDKEAREIYQTTADAIGIPLSTLLRLLLVSNIGKAQPLVDLLKEKLKKGDNKGE